MTTLLNSTATLANVPAFQLSSVAMLARLSVSQWTARKLDRKITDKVNREHNAAADAGRYNKLLISKDALARIQAIVGQARLEHEARTLPWHDRGARILSAVGYAEYTEKMQSYRREFESALDIFLAGYADYVADAKFRLNGLFNDGDYPHTDEIRGKFSFEVTLDNIPDSNDFRVAMSQAQADMIRADIEARTQRAVADAMRDVWQRVAESVGHMATKLRAYDPSNAKADCFRDTLVENIRELVALLPGLNVTGDSTLAAIASRMESELCGEDATRLRKDGTLRESVAAAAESILADVSDFLA